MGAVMKPVKHLISFLFACGLAACATTPDPFRFDPAAPPPGLAGRWQLVRAGHATEFDLTPSTRNHFQVTSQAGDATMDASIQRYQGVRYLVIADGAQSKGLSIFQVRDLRPTAIRLVALDPKKTAIVLNRRGMAVAYKAIWFSEQVYLTGPALQAILAAPAADVFALDAELTLSRVK
jgi:hypothetical protein